MTDLTGTSDAELLNAAIPLVEELLRRAIIGITIAIPSSTLTGEKVAQDFPEPDSLQVQDDHVVLFVNYSWEDTMDTPQDRPKPANSSRKLSPVSS